MTAKAKPDYLQLTRDTVTADRFVVLIEIALKQATEGDKEARKFLVDLLFKSSLNEVDATEGAGASEKLAYLINRYAARINAIDDSADAGRSGSAESAV
jgi:hypothetical protein